MNLFYDHHPPRQDSNQCRIRRHHNIPKAFFPTARAPRNWPPVQRTLSQTLKWLLSRVATVLAGFLMGYFAYYLAVHTGIIGKRLFNFSLFCVCW